jgi:hypothetical protein
MRDIRGGARALLPLPAAAPPDGTAPHGTMTGPHAEDSELGLIRNHACFAVGGDGMVER